MLLLLGHPPPMPVRATTNRHGTYLAHCPWMFTRLACSPNATIITALLYRYRSCFAAQSQVPGANSFAQQTSGLDGSLIDLTCFGVGDVAEAPPSLNGCPLIGVTCLHQHHWVLHDVTCDGAQHVREGLRMSCCRGRSTGSLEAAAAAGRSGGSSSCFWVQHGLNRLADAQAAASRGVRWLVSRPPSLASVSQCDETSMDWHMQLLCNMVQARCRKKPGKHMACLTSLLPSLLQCATTHLQSSEPCDSEAMGSRF